LLLSSLADLPVIIGVLWRGLNSASLKLHATEETKDDEP
jgi:hypothetical protein